nr:MAG TPA: hypothetical protein [Caudoviricetes sp.]
MGKMILKVFSTGKLPILNKGYHSLVSTEQL